MPLYLSIMEGPTAAEARPLIATGDPAVIAAVAREILKRLTPERAGKRILDLARKGKPEPGTGR